MAQDLDFIQRLGQEAGSTIGDLFLQLASDDYNKTINNMFGKLHGTNDYHSNDYQRVGFDSARASQDFCNDMSSLGITDVAGTSFKYNEQYLAEMPKTVDLSHLSSEQVSALNLPSGTNLSSVDSTTLISCWQEMSGYAAYQTNVYQTEKGKEDQNKQHVEYFQNQFSNSYTLLTGQLEMAGTVINKAVEMYQDFQKYDYNKINDSIFKNENSTWDTKTDTAYVINGNTVIMNGQVLDGNDPRTAEALGAYQHRMATANDIVNGTYSGGNCFNSFDPKVAMANAQQVQATAYCQEVAISGNYNDEKISSGERANGVGMGNLKSELDNLNNELAFRNYTVKMQNANGSTTNEVLYFDDKERAATEQMLKVAGVNEFSSEQHTFLNNIKNSDSTGITSTYGQRDGIKDAIDRSTHMHASELDNDTVNTLKQMGSRVNLDTSSMLISGASDTVTALASLGFSFPAGVALTYNDLFGVNSKIFDILAKNEINVFDKNGKFSAKLLEKVDFSKLGMNNDVKRLFIKMNTTEFGKGMFGAVMSKGMGFATGFTTILGKLDDDNATMEFIGDTKKAVNAGKYTAKVVQKTGKFAKIQAERLKTVLEKTKLGKNLFAENAKKKAAEQAAFNAEANARNVARHTGKLAKNLEKGKTVEKMRAKAGIKQRIKEAFFKTINIGSKGATVGAGAGAAAGAGGTAAGGGASAAAGTAGGTAAAPVIAVILLILFIILAALALIIVVVIVIQAFANLDSQFIYNALAPATEQDTVAYMLYEKLEAEEEAWINNITTGTAEGVFGMPEEFRYTAEYLTYDELMEPDELTGTSKAVSGLTTYQGQLAINPFGGMAKELLVGQDAWTKLYFGIDGKITTSISANTNYYNRMLMTSASGERGETGRFTAIENGHTSNTKDIIAMTDILYQMDVAEAFDGDENSGLQSQMGKSPAQVDYQHIYSQISAGLKWIGSKIGSLFGKGDGPTTSFWTALKGTGTVSYGTIENYVVNMFTASHQEMIFLDVEYFNNIVDPRTSEEIMDDRPVETNNITGSMLDICNSPYENVFELGWFGNVYAAYLEDSYGYKYLLDDEDFKQAYNSQVLITLENMCKPSESCLWLEPAMDLNEPVQEWYFPFNNPDKEAEINKVIGKLNGGKGENDKKCWEYFPCGEEGGMEVQIAKAYEGDVTTEWYSFGGDDADEQSEALAEEKEALETALQEEWKKWTPTYWWIQNNTIPYLEVKTINKGTAYAGAGVGTDRDEYEIEHALLRNIIKPKDGLSYHWEEIEGTRGCYYDCPDDCEYEHKEYCYRLVSDDDGPIVLLEEWDDTWERKCQGHKFKYCGGHLSLHTQGIVFSVTNEQIGMTEILDDNNPVANNFDLAANGYDEIRGKYDNVNYTTALTASQTGACLTVAYDKAQGSDTAQSGLNLLIDGDNWASGLEWKKLLEDVPEGEESEPQENTDADDTATLPADTFKRARDIFDIDCMLLKGNNVLPIRLDETEDGKIIGFDEFESWTADNMTLVTTRIPVDWTDIYKFDIPYEINQVAINEEDRELILNALADRYGSNFTETRRNAVDLTLSWVGRGHYNENHNLHNFLLGFCKAGIGSTDGNCTAGTSEDFAKFIYCKTVKRLNNDGTPNTGASVDFRNMSGSSVSTGFTNCLPGDIIEYHTTIPESTIQFCLENPDEVTKNGIETMMRHGKETDLNIVPMYAVYIGNLNETITLSSGQILQKNCPITVCLENVNGVGNVWLTGRHSVTEIYDEMSFATVIGADGSNRNGTGLAQNFWWVENDETNAKRISIE